MRSIESTGRSIDEAIFHGLQQLEISIEALMESAQFHAEY